MNLKLFAFATALHLATPAAAIADDEPAGPLGSVPYSSDPGQSTNDGQQSSGQAASAETYNLWYDIIYDQGNTSLSSVACSSGENGLLTQGYNVFSDLHSFPFIGGAPQIQGWNSPSCGTCWELTHTDTRGISTSLSFLAINMGSPSGGFTISREAMNSLTGGNADTLNGLVITATQLPASACNM